MKWYRHCAAHFREEDEAGPRLRAYVFDGTMETTTGLDVRSPEMALGNESSICNTRRGNSVPTGAGNKRGKPAGWKMPTWSQCQGRESQCWGLWVTEAHTPHKRDAVTMLHEITAIPLGFSKEGVKLKHFQCTISQFLNVGKYTCLQHYVGNQNMSAASLPGGIGLKLRLRMLNATLRDLDFIL